MTDLLLAQVFAAAFVVTVTPFPFWADAVKSVIVVMCSLTLASLWRDIFPGQEFYFDQQIAFAVCVAGVLFAMSRFSYRLPSLLVMLLVFWVALELLALIFIGKPVHLSDYWEQGVIVYFPALVIAWAIVFFSSSFTVRYRERSDGI